MLHHLSLGVRDLQRSIAFYDAVLAPLGYRRLWTRDDGAGYGEHGTDEPLAIKLESGSPPLGSSPRSHLAVAAPTKAAVIAFHEAALRNGGRDWGTPGPRPHYGEHYFAAFVDDPDGYRIEAVCTTA